MPNPVCVSCNSSHSLLWRNSDGGRLCHHCYLIEGGNGNSTSNTPEDENAENEEVKPESETAATTSNSAVKSSVKKGGNRWTRAKSASTTGNSTSGTATQKSSNTTRGRGRRTLFKRPPLKAPSPTSTIVTSETIYFNGTYMQVGDIVSLLDENGETYYAQIRGFITDQYCEKSAVITWLLPTKASPPPSKCFDPATYIIGPEEDLPRKLEYMEFVMHAPSDYYKSKSNPYPPVEAEIVSKALSGFIWSSIEPVDKL